MSSSMTTASPRVKGWKEAEERWWDGINPLLAEYRTVLKGVACVLLIIFLLLKIRNFILQLGGIAIMSLV